MKKTIFTGAAPAIITPMNKDFSINYDAFAKTIEFYITNDADAIVVAGTTGESSTFTDKEHIEVVKFAVDTVKGRIPVIAGVGSNDTYYAKWLTKEAEACGADALLHSTPYYNKTSQAGLIRHFTNIADNTKLPIILYNVPGRTGMTIKPETYLELSKHPNIVATKEASGDISHILQTAYLCGDDLDIYSGNDDQIVPVMAIGGKGVISVLACVAPRETSLICKLFLEGKTAESLELQKKYLKLIDSLFIDVNPIPVKAAMNLLGFNAGPCREPLVEMNNSALAQLKAEMLNHNLINSIK